MSKNYKPLIIINNTKSAPSAGVIEQADYISTDG